MEKPGYSLLCTFVQAAMQDSQVQPTSTKDPLKYIEEWGERGERRNLLCQVTVLPCPFQNITTTSQRILWSSMASLVVHESDGQKKQRMVYKVLLPATVFQEVICDTQEASSTLVIMIIILKEGKRKGKETAWLYTNSNYFSILFLSHPSHQTM